MKRIFIIIALLFVAIPLVAQADEASDQRQRVKNTVTGWPVPGPFQALGNIIRNPNTPVPEPATPISGAPLPTIIPPNTIGQPQPQPQR